MFHTRPVSLVLYAWLVVIFSYCLREQHMAQAAAVMSVDLGAEWMKVGVVSPGVPMDIALNRESKRKTPAILSFRDGIRTFGEDAVTVGIREPAAAYGYLLDLLGKTVDNPVVELYRKRFPYYDIVGDPVRNTVIFKKGDDEQFSVEELVAQMLVKAKEFAQESTNQPLSECVLTVPGYFGQAEREAMLSAAHLANLKVLQLINDYAAVALNYGVFHRGEINETAQYYIFYDMGAYKTTAALVSYQLVKDKHSKETNPIVQVLGVGYDRTLGGLEIQLRLRDYLAAEFNELNKTKTDVTTSPRALAKLFKEAGRVKNVLSANNEHYAQIENLIDDQDFKHLVTREKLEELCADLWPRTIKPLQQAISTSGLSLAVVSQVIIFGGGTRIPKVQETIKQMIKQELGKSLNADEAAAIGAVYKAADLSIGFKVKKFIVKDAVVFPLQVSFERDPRDGAAVKQVKRVLFSAMNPYPQKKVITFNKHSDDFEFYVHYGDLDYLGPTEIIAIGSLNITTVELQKVKELLEQSVQNLVEVKGIKAYFYMDDSGIFHCTGVEYVYDKQQHDNNGDDASTLAKLGSTISKLFTNDDKSVTEEEEQKQQSSAQDGEKPVNENLNKTEEERKETVKNKTDAIKLDKDLIKEKNETFKLITVKEPVTHKIRTQFVPPLNGDAYEKSAQKLHAINNAEELRTHLETAFNALESHIIEVQQKLDEEPYASCATNEEKEELLTECSRLAEWLYEDVGNPTPELYEQKLNDLRNLSNVFLGRHWEHEERPQAIKALIGMIEGAQKFLATAKNLTSEADPDKDVFTMVEIETLAKVIDDTNSWQESETAAQAKLDRNENVRLTVKEITEKMALLDREVKYLVNKLKIWKPKINTSKKDKKMKSKENEYNTTTDAKEDAGNNDSASAEAEIKNEPTEETVINAQDEKDDVREQFQLPETATPINAEEAASHSEL